MTGELSGGLSRANHGLNPVEMVQGVYSRMCRCARHSPCARAVGGHVRTGSFDGADGARPGGSLDGLSRRAAPDHASGPYRSRPEPAHLGPIVASGSVAFAID